jgi:hypothetical protein
VIQSGQQSVKRRVVTILHASSIANVGCQQDT